MYIEDLGALLGKSQGRGGGFQVTAEMSPHSLKPPPPQVGHVLVLRPQVGAVFRQSGQAAGELWCRGGHDSESHPVVFILPTY